MVAEFKAPHPHAIKLLDHLEYAKSSRYLKQLEEEEDYLTKRLAFLHEQKRKVVKYRLTH